MGGALEQIEGYNILEKIGEGGMGQVFRALHRRLDRQVAIKRLAPQLSQNQDMLKRFLQEARLQARLPHPNVVSIFDLVENEQGIFLIMEHVEGLTAKAMLAGRDQLTMPETLAIAEGVLCGLAFMHKNGVVHRDIKPSNIMVSKDGLVKVTDFGIARLVDEESGLTRFGGGIGTLHYMAPELIRAGTVSFAVDIYSLGATLHELLSGSPPFVGNTDLEIMMGHLEKEPLPLTRLPDDAAGQGCRDIIARALAKSPENRFPSAEAFLEAVRRLRATLPPLAQWPLAGSETEAIRAGDGQQTVCPPAAGDTDATLPGQAAPADDASRTVAPAPPGEATGTVAQTAAAPSVPERPVLRDQATAIGPVQAQALEDPSQARTPRPASPGSGRRRKGLWGGLALAVVLGLGGYLVLGTGGKTPLPPAATSAAPQQVNVPAPPAVATAPQETVAARDPGPSPEAAAATPSEIAAGQAPAVAAAVAAPVSEPSPMAAPTDAPPLPSAAAAASVPFPAAAPAAVPEAAQAGEEAASEPPSTPARPEASPPPAAPAAQTPTAAAPAKPAQPPAKPETLFMAVDQARLLDRPSDTAAVLARLDKGTRVTVLARDGDWMQIATSGGRTGFVRATWTATATPPPPPAAVRAAAKPVLPRPAAKPGAEPQSGWRITK